MQTLTVKSLYSLFPIIVCFLSCSENNNKNEIVKENNPKFIAFLEKIPAISLPVIIKGCSINTQHLKRVENENFVTEEAINYVYGKFEFNNKYIAIILLASADCEIPVIVTFDKFGNKIDEKEITLWSRRLASSSLSVSIR